MCIEFKVDRVDSPDSITPNGLLTVSQGSVIHPACIIDTALSMSNKP